MRMNIQAFRGEIKCAKPHPCVLSALNGDPDGANIVTPMLNNKCVTPNDKFNAITASLQLLRFKPDRQLIKKPITEVYEPGSLEHTLATILNHTIERQPADEYVHTTHNPRPLHNDEVRQYCHEAEIGFIDSALKLNESRTKVYVDDNGQPVFFKKFFPRGITTALAMQAINYNGVEIPPGTIVDLKEKSKARYMPKSGTLEVRHIDDPNLISAYPLRLTSFSLNDKDRYETFGAYNQKGKPLSPIERQANVEFIKNHLPSPAELAVRLNVEQQMSNIPYAV